MIKNKKKRKPQVNSTKRKKDFLKWIFGCTNNAISLSIKYHGVNLNDPVSVSDFIKKRTN